MRVLIAEQAHVGHYYTYVRYLLHALRPLGVEVVLALTPQGLASDEFRIHLSESVNGVEIRPILQPVRFGARGILAAIFNLRRVCKEIRPDALYIPSGDWIGQSAGLARMIGLSPVPCRVHSEILINRLSFTYPAYKKSPLVRKLSLAALRFSPWTKIHITDRLAYEWLQQTAAPANSRPPGVAFGASIAPTPYPGTPGEGWGEGQSGLTKTDLIERRDAETPRRDEPKRHETEPLPSKHGSPFSAFSATRRLGVQETFSGKSYREKGLPSRLTLAPDPIEEFPPLSHIEARERLNIPIDGRYLVCAGVLDSRKGIGPLLAAFSSAALNSSDRLLLAGPVADDIRPLLNSPASRALVESGRLIVIDRVLSTAEISTITSAANVITCPYPDQPHPVSMAMRALCRNRPVLGADTYWLGQMIPRFQMGWTVNVADPTTFAQIIRRALDASADWIRSGPATELAKFASVENFKACWVVGLCAMLESSASK